ncbi:MAG TPA: hypothetical protein VKM55_00840 [Candidatus Lokiarchaeia archaeon]|nr:hypothetical protein [Candidatus Lokiarchaeia archaeon]
MNKTQSDTIVLEKDEIKEKTQDLVDSLNAIKIAQYFLRARLSTNKNDKVQKHLEIINQRVDRAHSKIREILGDFEDSSI